MAAGPNAAADGGAAMGMGGGIQVDPAPAIAHGHGHVHFPNKVSKFPTVITF